MTDHGERTLSSGLKSLASNNPHLAAYLKEQRQETGEYPLVVEADEVPEYETSRPNILYRVDQDAFIHVYGEHGEPTSYRAIEPELKPGERGTFDTIKKRILLESSKHPVPGSKDREEVIGYVDELLDSVLIDSEETGLLPELKDRFDIGVRVDPEVESRVRYQLHRDIAGLGPLHPVMMDPNNEDIHVIGHAECYVDHDPFGLLETNVHFGSPPEFDTYLKNLGERMNNPVSDAEPIIDSTLPDGSRVNIVYSDDVSVKGPSLTIRQGEEVPLSILQITKWGTLSPKMAAYLWLCLENEQTVFVVGETASGKTTTLNALLTFIPNDSKIYTAEDTTEVIPPQDAWQQLKTRESPDEESTDVDMMRLVEAALRSRPDYIIVGEVRGEEARMAFQAAQTGHPVMLTFHASDIKSMIERFTGDPLNVPETNIDNADVALFQNRVKRDDGEMLRRVTSVSEIVGYSDEVDGIISKEVFTWDSADDVHEFTGMNNSYVLEDQVAELLGYEDTTKIYDELNRREEIIRRLIDSGVLGYEEVNGVINTIQEDGVKSAPINTAGLTR